MQRLAALSVISAAATQPGSQGFRWKELHVKSISIPAWRHWLIAVTVVITQACVTVHAPLLPDVDYPTDWPAVSTLGPECNAIAGIYANDGVVVTPNGGRHAITLASVLNQAPAEGTVSLDIRTRKTDKHGDTFSTLIVVPDGNIAAKREMENCFCLKQTLACTEVAESYWSIPSFGAGGSQKNVYIAVTQDHSLIVRLQNYHLDVVLGIPAFGKSEPWALFKRTDK